MFHAGQKVVCVVRPEDWRCAPGSPAERSPKPEFCRVYTVFAASFCRCGCGLHILALNEFPGSVTFDSTGFRPAVEPGASAGDEAIRWLETLARRPVDPDAGSQREDERELVAGPAGFGVARRGTAPGFGVADPHLAASRMSLSREAGEGVARAGEGVA